MDDSRSGEALHQLCTLYSPLRLRQQAALMMAQDVVPACGQTSFVLDRWLGVHMRPQRLSRGELRLGSRVRGRVVMSWPCVLLRENMPRIWVNFRPVVVIVF